MDLCVKFDGMLVVLDVKKNLKLLSFIPVLCNECFFVFEGGILGSIVISEIKLNILIGFYES